MAHTGQSSSGGHTEYDHPPAETKTYFLTIGALFCLTFLTVVVAHFDFGFLNTVVAMLIATIKATLVLLLFMHLLHDTWMNRLVMLTGLFFLIVLFGFAYGDIITRIKIIWGN